MTHGSLFSGIGGFDLAAEWMGWENIFHCEWNPFGQKVLKHHFPNSISYNDIKKTDFSIHRGKIDILTGGFPCQPYSLAGKRKGKEDDRHLFPEMLRAIREIQPSWVVGENVFGIISWSGALVFNEVQTDLEAEGYEVFPYVLPACAVNAPHRRDRVWFIAHRNNERRFENSNNSEWESLQFKPHNGEQIQHNDSPISCYGNTSNPNSNGKHEVNTSEGREYALGNVEQIIMYSNGSIGKGQHIGQAREREFNRPNSRIGTNYFENFPTQSPICGRDDGLPTELDGITFSKWRNESIKAFGNAIVPQVAFEIFKAIEKYNNLK